MTELIIRRLFIVRTLYIKIAVALVLFLQFEEVMGFLLDVLHTAYEAFEYVLELTVAYLFHTGHRETEIITFNILLILAFCILLIFVRMLPRLLHKLHGCLVARWDGFKSRLAENWVTLSLLQKMKTVATSTLVFSFFAVLVFI